MLIDRKLFFPDFARYRKEYMKKLSFMAPQTLKSRSFVEASIKEILEDEYPKAVEKALTQDILEDFLNYVISKAQIEKKFQKIEGKLHKKTKIKITLLENVLKELEEILENPQSYHDDLMSAIYMGLTYSDERNDLFGDFVKQSLSETKVDNEAEIIREKLRSIWSRNNKANMIEKQEIRKYYPIPIIDEIDENGERKILSIPGSCWKYHSVMISQENIGLFDIKTQSSSYQKYSFHKIYAIYEQLKEAKIENLLLMEYTIGMGYANQSYAHLRKIGKMEDLNKVCKIIDKGAEISTFFLRKKVMNVLWRYMDLYLLNEEDLNNAGIILQCVKELVDEIYYKSLELWWYAYYLKCVKADLNIWQLGLKAKCNDYFTDWEVYDDWIKYCGVHDWRNVHQLQDCFALVDDDNIFSLMLYRTYVDVEDILGAKRKIQIDIPSNSIGKVVLSRCGEELKKIVFPKESEKMTELYLAIRKNVYDELYKEESNKFYNHDIKVREKQKVVKKHHIYAIIIKNIIEIQLK